MHDTAESKFRLSEATFYTSNLFFSKCSPLKGFLLIVPLKETRDQQNFRFWLWGVQFDSAVWYTLQSLILWYDAHRGAWLLVGMHTTELDSAVWCTKWILTLRCDAHCRVFWEIWVTPRSFTLRYDAHRGVRQLWKCPFSCFRICYVFQLRFI